MDGPKTLIIIIVAIAVWLVGTYFLARWVFAIKRQLWNQKTRINLLIKIAEKQGVPASDLDNIHEINNGDD